MRWLLVMLCVFGFGYCVCTMPLLADTVALTNPQALSMPSASKLSWRVAAMDAGEQRLVVEYRWLDATDTVIPVGGRDRWQTWECAGECFTDVFTFHIRSQDVGKSIGAGLRSLIWNKFKAAMLTTGNDGTFE